MKEKLTNNISLKIMSVIVGFLIWLIVVNVDNPVVTTTFTLSFSNIELANEAYLESTGMMCMLDENQQQIKVHITGDRKTVRRLSANDLHAVADLQQIVSLDTDPAMVPITVTCGGISSSNIEVTPNNLMMHLREKLTQEFVVNVTAGDSKPGKGYEIGSLTSEPEKIKITGPSSLVNKIGNVTATVNVDGKTANTTEETTIRILDKNGDALSETQMNYLNVERNIKVNTNLWKVRSNVIIEADYSGNPQFGYRVDSISTIPDVLNLAGTDEALNALEDAGNTITIPADCIDVSGLNMDLEAKINITDYLPEGLKLTSGSSEDVWVKATILPLGSNTYYIPTKDILVRNLSSQLQVVFETDKIEIRVLEAADDLPILNLTEIEAYIDLDKKEAGSYEVPVSFVLPEGYSLVDEVNAEIRISAVSGNGAG